MAVFNPHEYKCRFCKARFSTGCGNCPTEENRRIIHKFVGIRKIENPQQRKHNTTYRGSNWKETRHNKTTIIWEYWKGGFSPHAIKFLEYSITIEARFDKTLNLWLVYGAMNGKGLPENPIEVVNKKEAISSIAMLKKRYEKGGIGALKNVWEKL